MKLKSATAIAAIGISVVAPCFAGKVKTWFPPGTDFSQYKTYTWLPTKVLGKAGIVENDPTFDPIIRGAVGKELQRIGLKEVPQGGDLQVSVIGLGTSVPQLEAVMFAGYDPANWGTTTFTMGRYNKEGTLAVNLIDPKLNKSVWAGAATETLKTTPGAGKEKIPVAAQRIFKDFPGKPGK
ncbi:MAG TPA: DUF4136 domain-containing protein [Candidatus Acidoferrales bacterium]|nr:DUF4136 domain-containing protein [Candidatus Acidoferrales bacterium]